MRSRLPLIALASLAGACASQRFTFAPLSFDGIHDTTRDRVVLLSEREVHFHSGSDGRAYAEEVVHCALRANRPDVIERSVDVQFDRTFLQRPSLQARVVFPDGSAVSVPGRAWDIPAFDRHALYMDQRILHLPVPAVPPGAALEFISRQRVVDLAPLQFMHPFGSVDPVVRARLTVTLPEAWELEWRATRLGEPYPLEPQVTVAEGRRTYVWEQSELPAWAAESYGVEVRHELPRVTLRLKSWQEQGEQRRAPATVKELSAWVYEKTHALSAPDDAMRATVQRLLQGAGDDPREKARRLYQHAVENVRYCAIAIGYGGWFPHPATEVEKKRYGDCKDKANYLQGLLDAAGIKSRPVALFAHQGYPAPVGMPSLVGNFNHQALLIDLPGGAQFVDPTTRSVPFGDVPPQDREATLMPIEPGGGALLTAPASSPDEHREVQTVTLTLDANGDGRGTFDVNADGIPAALLRDRLLHTMPRRRGEVASDWLDLDQVHVESVTSLTGMELGKSLAITGRLEAPRVVARSDGAGVVRLSTLAPRWLPVLPGTERRTPVVLARFHSTRQGVVRLTTATGVEVRALPKAVALDNAWFRYRLAFRRDGKTLVAERELVLKKRIVPAADAAALREALALVHRAENAPLLVEEVDK